MSRAPAESRSAFPHFEEITTRWKDNDLYGHVNNVVYYSYFDTAVNTFLIGQGVVDLVEKRIVGLVAETQCRFIRELAFPDAISVGLRIVHLGNSSVRWEIGIFRNAEDTACAQGYFVQVYVDRVTGQKIPIPPAMQRAASLIYRPSVPSPS